MNNKKAFSFIELLIVVSIMILLAVMAVSVNNSMKTNAENTQIVADIDTLKNALEVYQAEKKELPMPKGNLNFFDNEGSYVHEDFETKESKAFGVYGKATEKLIPKSYLDSPLIDPRTNNFYSYGVTKDKQEFEIAGVLYEGDSFLAKVSGNYTAETGPYGLIREYNGAELVVDGEGKLPYNPYEKKLIATDENGNIYNVGDTIKTKGTPLEIYFSDGSVSKLEANSELVIEKLDFPNKNNLVSKVYLTLNAGAIWTKATRLIGGGTPNDVNASEFVISTDDTVAAVRGTIFKVGKSTQTTIGVIKGKVVVDTKKDNTKQIELIDGKSVIVDNFSTVSLSNFTETIDDFGKPTPRTTNETPDTDTPKATASCFLEGKEHKEGEEFDAYNNECETQKVKCKNGEVVIAGEVGERMLDYKYNSCCLYLEDDGNCVKGDSHLIENGYKLVAYAPYNGRELTMERQRGGSQLQPTKGSFPLYYKTEGGKEKKNTEGGTKPLAEGCNYATGKKLGSTTDCNYKDKEGNPIDGPGDMSGIEKVAAKDTTNATEKYRHPFYTDGTTTGVFLDIYGDPDYLKYDLSDLKLGENEKWALEIKVETRALKQDGGRFIFDTENNKGLAISKNSNGKFKIRYNKQLKCNNCDLKFNSNFEKISIINDGENSKLKIGGKEFKIDKINIQNLYPGSREDKIGQLNGIIDYVKIYKK